MRFDVLKMSQGKKSWYEVTIYKLADNSLVSKRSFNKKSEVITYMRKYVKE